MGEAFMLKQIHRPLVETSSNKRQRTTNHKSPEILVEIPTSENIGSPPRILRALLDSGSTGCIILNEFTKGIPKKFGDTERWTTKGGIFTTKGKCTVPMILVDFTRSTTVEFDCYVDPTQTSNESNYDLILGKDFQQEFGIDILNSSLTLKWNGIEVPMREFGELRDRNTATKQMMLWTSQHEADSTSEMQSRVTRILDAKYEKADLKTVVQNQKHLSDDNKLLLAKLLRKYEHLFDGTLGDWKGSGVSFELRDDAKPYHSKPYPIPHIHEMPTKKEVSRLCELGVLKECTESEWGAPSFIIPKKNNTVRFLSDFRRLNSMLTCKTETIPYPEDSGYVTKTGGIYVRDCARSQYGLLYHKTQPGCPETMYYSTTVG
jgi:hypothetical protein